MHALRIKTAESSIDRQRSIPLRCAASDVISSRRATRPDGQRLKRVVRVTVLAILLWILFFLQKNRLNLFVHLSIIFFQYTNTKYVLNIGKHLIHPSSIKGLTTACQNG